MVNEEPKTNGSPHETQALSPYMRKILLIISCVVLSVGNCGGPLIMRLYFIHGGKKIWLSSWLLTAGWPLIIVVLIATLYHRRTTMGDSTVKLFNIKPRLILASAFIGILIGVNNYLYSYGVAKLPVSTSSLVIASELAFTAGFAYFLVKQKFTSYSVNAIVLLTLGSVVLALHGNSDRPNGESIREYSTGFIMIIGAAALHGLISPLMELTYQKSKQVIDFPLVMEIQMIICMFATLFCTVGMLINNDFKEMPREARNFDLGETKYYAILVCSGIVWPLFFIGAGGVIFCSSSLLSGIIISALVPVIEVLAVIFYKEKFQATKGVALVLALWGFASYFYGEIKHRNKAKKNRTPGTELQLNQVTVEENV